MSTAALELEGSWEEILARASEWVGRRVRLTVLAEQDAGLAEGENAFWGVREPADVFASQGVEPVEDVDAFVESLPHPQDAHSLWDAVAADRAERRAEDHP